MTGRIGIAISGIIQVYSWLIVAYVLASWFPGIRFIDELRDILTPLVEPYLGLFRRFVPPIGMIDISPIVALLVLNIVQSLLRGI